MNLPLNDIDQVCVVRYLTNDNGLQALLRELPIRSMQQTDIESQKGKAAYSHPTVSSCIAMRDSILPVSRV